MATPIGSTQPALTEELRTHLHRHPGYLVNPEPAISGPYSRQPVLTHRGSFLLGVVVGASVVAGALSMGTRLLPFMPF